jgi:hypothetical protein
MFGFGAMFTSLVLVDRAEASRRIGFARGAGLSRQLDITPVIVH